MNVKTSVGKNLKFYYDNILKGIHIIKYISDKETFSLEWYSWLKRRVKKNLVFHLYPSFSQEWKGKRGERSKKPYLMHIWIYKNFKRSNGQGDIWRSCWNGKHVMEGLLPHIMGINCLHQITIGNSHHRSIYCKF